MDVFFEVATTTSDLLEFLGIIFESVYGHKRDRRDKYDDARRLPGNRWSRLCGGGESFATTTQVYKQPMKHHKFTTNLNDHGHTMYITTSPEAQRPGQGNQVQNSRMHPRTRSRQQQTRQILQSCLKIHAARSREYSAVRRCTAARVVDRCRVEVGCSGFLRPPYYKEQVLH